jgi:hypothetical protein
MICASTGWPVEARARATMAYSRALRVAAMRRPRSVDLRGKLIVSIFNHILYEPTPLGIDGSGETPKRGAEGQ